MIHYHLFNAYVLNSNTLSVEKAAGKPSESINASVAQEWPPAAHILRAFHIDFHNGRLSLVGRGAVEKFALHRPERLGQT